MNDKYILRVIAEAACERLMQQIDQLKADVEEVTNDNIRLSQENGGLRGERDRLKSEVDSLGDTLMHAETERDAFKAEVERLRKAGDIMLLALWLGVDGYSKEQKEKAEEAWNAANEGKDL